MKCLTIQDISCYGSCSTTVALPILSHFGIETAILPSAILSTHTSGFKDFVVHDLTFFMPEIIDHWIKEGIKFDTIYTGYIGNSKQFDYILKCKDELLNEGGLFIVDPAMADNNKLYPALDQSIVTRMKEICMVADYIIPNITEACFLTNNEYKDIYDSSYIDKLLRDLYSLGCKNVILTGVRNGDLIGCSHYDGVKRTDSFIEKEEKSYHGTGDIFSSIVVAKIMKNKPIKTILDDAVGFIVECIKQTKNDEEHTYAVKYEEVLDRQN